MTGPMSDLAVSRAGGFATRDARPGERLRQWEQHNADRLIALSCAPPRVDGFDACEVNLDLTGVHLATVRGNRHRVERTEELIDHHPTDAIAVYLMLRGDSVMEHDGRSQTLRAGQLLVCDADRPFRRHLGHGFEELVVKAPRDAVAGLTGRATLTEPVVVDLGHEVDGRLGRALARLGAGAVRETRLPPPNEQALLDLVGALAAGTGPIAPATHRARARAYVDACFTDPGLSAARIAHAVGISERQLSRVLAEAGTSVPRELLRRRLDAAYQRLASTTDTTVLTTDVAAGCGLTSAAHFARTFRDRFGVRAGDVRRSALRAARHRTDGP